MTIIWYMVPEISTATDRLFCHLWPCFAPNSPKNENFVKLKKSTWRYYHFTQKCIKNHNHRLYCSWAMCAGCNCYFSFWTIFYPFTPLTAPKMKISKNWKKHLEVSSFYTSAPKIMITGYAVPEIWCVPDVIIFHFELFFTFLTHQQPEKWKYKEIEKSTWRYHHFTLMYHKSWS